MVGSVNGNDIQAHNDTTYPVGLRPLDHRRRLSRIMLSIPIRSRQLFSSLVLVPVRDYHLIVVVPGGELASTGQVDDMVACRGCQAASLNTWRNFYMPTLS